MSVFKGQYSIEVCATSFKQQGEPCSHKLIAQSLFFRGPEKCNNSTTSWISATAIKQSFFLYICTYVWPWMQRDVTVWKAHIHIYSCVTSPLLSTLHLHNTTVCCCLILSRCCVLKTLSRPWLLKRQQSRHAELVSVHNQLLMALLGSGYSASFRCQCTEGKFV